MNELEKTLAEYKEKIQGKDLNELRELEHALVAEAQEADKEAAEKAFELKGENGAKLTAARRANIGKTISAFLAKSQSNWQQALTIKYLIDFWQGKDMNVPYPVIDNTLRMLGQVTFTGIDEIEDVAAVNDFFEGIRTEFMEFTNKLYEIANRHEIVMNEIALQTAPQTEAE